MMHNEIRWEVAATSGMMGTDIDEEFIDGLTRNELEYFLSSITDLKKLLTIVKKNKGWNK